ncbi:MAG: TonB family protein [Fibromonadaceae bacterium]|nr:TonB family protein [Fibromonadaceae bacterium]
MFNRLTLLFCTIFLLLTACGSSKGSGNPTSNDSTDGRAEFGGRRGIPAEGSSQDKLGSLMIGHAGDYKLPQGTVKTPDLEDIDIDSDASRSKPEIRQAVEARMPSLRRIYSDYLKEKSNISGKIIFKFTIVSSGEIIDISVISSTTGFPEFEKEIQRKIATWKWKAIEGGNTTVTIPFNFIE